MESGVGLESIHMANVRSPKKGSGDGNLASVEMYTTCLCLTEQVNICMHALGEDIITETNERIVSRNARTSQ